MSEPSYEELRCNLKQAKEKLARSEQKLRELGVEDMEPKPAEEEAKVVIELCHHVKEDSRLCGSPAVTGRRYCGYHLKMRGRRLKMARARARRERWLVQLPPLEDLYAVQVGLQHVLDALASGQLDRRLGYAMLYGLQQAAGNLRLPKEAWDKSCRFGNAGQSTWPGFEAAHGLPDGFDVDTPPEEAFPPPATSPGTIDATGEDGVSADDLELEELQTLDAEACKRRAAQLVRKYERRMQRDRERLSRVLRVQEAARRNHEARKKEPATVSAEAGSADGGVVSTTVTPQPELSTNAASGTVPAETGVPAIGGETKKSPQGEPNKEDERAKGSA